MAKLFCPKLITHRIRHRLDFRHSGAGRIPQRLESSSCLTGPTAAELKARDHTNFPYVRSSATIAKDGELAPVMWDRKGQPGGNNIVAFSNGTVEYLGEAELLRLLKEHGQRRE